MADLNKQLRLIEYRNHRAQLVGSDGHHVPSKHIIKTLGTSARDVPPLLAAVRAVLEVHKPVEFIEGTGCNRCMTYVGGVDDAVHEEWPCATVKAIEKELGE